MLGTLPSTGDILEMNLALQELTMSGKQTSTWCILMPVTSTMSELYSGQWRTIESEFPAWLAVGVGMKGSARKKNFLK